MYIEAYRLMLTLASLPVVLLLAIVGYSLGGPAGGVIGAVLPSALLIGFLYLRTSVAELKS